MTDLYPHGFDGFRTMNAVRWGRHLLHASFLPEVTINLPAIGTQSKSPLYQPQSLAKCKEHTGDMPQYLSGAVVLSGTSTGLAPSVIQRIAQETYLLNQNF